MSTRSFNAREYEPGKYRAIYCHNDGYIEHNGKLLVENYNSPEKVDEVLALGDLSHLTDKLYPNPNAEHSFDKRQEGVTVSYARDRGENNTEAKEYTYEELVDLLRFCDFVYLYDKDNVWMVLPYDSLDQEFIDLQQEVDLIREYYEAMEMSL